MLAGHRDTHFRALKQIAIGDRIRLRTERGVFGTRWTTRSLSRPLISRCLAGKTGLTLVTCYPFTYVGSAPQRFVVTAIRTEAGQRAEDKGQRPERLTPARSPSFVRLALPFALYPLPLPC